MFDLRKHERTIIAILVAALLLGLSISAYRRSHPGVKIDIKTGAIDLKDESPKININEAGVDELMKLRGIGRAIAERIVEYRAQKGSFVMTEEIKNVKGVGPALFGKIKDRISVE